MQFWMIFFYSCAVCVCVCMCVCLCDFQAKQRSDFLCTCELFCLFYFRLRTNSFARVYCIYSHTHTRTHTNTHALLVCVLCNVWFVLYCVRWFAFGYLTDVFWWVDIRLRLTKFSIKLEGVCTVLTPCPVISVVSFYSHTHTYTHTHIYLCIYTHTHIHLIINRISCV